MAEDLLQPAHRKVGFNLTLPDVLETDRVRLFPFDLATHGRLFYDIIAPDVDNLVKWMPFSFSTYELFADVIQNFMEAREDATLFGVLDKTKPDYVNNLSQSLAGIIGYIYSSPANRSIEIGPVLTAPAFQRTFITSNAIGIMLKAVLNLPEEGGLGFRRVVWTANPLNLASVGAAEKMGFRKEGIMRWQWCLPEEKEGKAAPAGRGSALGRDSIMLSLCWDDWENGAKEKVQQIIDRV